MQKSRSLPTHVSSLPIPLDCVGRREVLLTSFWMVAALRTLVAALRTLADKLGNLLDYGESIVATCRNVRTSQLRVACVMELNRLLVTIDGFAVRSLDLRCSEVLSTRAFALLRTRLRPFVHKVTKCAQWRDKTQNQVCLLAFLLNAVNASAIYSLRCCSRSLQKWCEDASSVDDLIWVRALLETEG